MSDRLSRALQEIQAVLEDQRRERDEVARQVAELEVSLDAARSAAAERERALMDANSRLLGQVEELSATAARMQAQVRAGQRRTCMARCHLFSSPLARSLARTRSPPHS
jgi:hypothetical protein